MCTHVQGLKVNTTMVDSYTVAYYETQIPNIYLTDQVVFKGIKIKLVHKLGEKNNYYWSRLSTDLYGPG